MTNDKYVDGLFREVKRMQKTRALGKCPFCGKPVDPNSFRDELSKREFQISGLCQKCQDDFFGADE